MTMSALFEDLPGLLRYGPTANQFSATGRGTHREGCVVRFFPEGAKPWVGNFQRGFGSPRLMTQPWPHSFPVICFVLLIAISASGAVFAQNSASEKRPQRPCKQIQFSGEVREGRRFQKQLNSNLVFRLEPHAEPSVPGWTINLHPSKGIDADLEFSWVVTPPFRLWNPRYLNVSYGYSAKEAVSIKERTFSFVLNREGYEAASAAVQKLLWPHGHSEHELAEAQRLLDSVRKGTGKLVILDSKVREPENGPGVIEWLRFQVELCIPSTSESVRDKSNSKPRPGPIGIYTFFAR
jgi:hypothetical protein